MDLSHRQPVRHVHAVSVMRRCPVLAFVLGLLALLLSPAALAAYGDDYVAYQTKTWPWDQAGSSAACRAFYDSLPERSRDSANRCRLVEVNHQPQYYEQKYCSGAYPIFALAPDGVTPACLPEPPTSCDISKYPNGHLEEELLFEGGPPGELFCYESCRFTYDGPTSSSVPWIYANGTKIYWVNGISSGQTCQADEIPDAWVDNGTAIPDRWDAEDTPFGQFLDAEGCYTGIGNDRFCQVETGGCPNSVTAPDGKRYCLMPDDDDEDPDDPTDPGDPGDPDDPDNPDNPDEPEEPEVYCDENGGWNGSSYCNAGDDGHWGPGCGWDCGGDDGGGGNDGDGDGDGDDGGGDGDNGGGNGGGDSGGDGGSGGDGDGDGGGDGDQDDGDNGEGDGEGGGMGPGTCDVDGQDAPECTEDQDSVQCAIALNTWYLNCRDKLWKEDTEGTDEYLASDSLLTDSEKNTLREHEIDLSDRLSDLDDSGGGFGGSASCPSDKDINLGRLGTITIPMSFLCDWAQRINPFVQALGWLAAALIVVSRMSEN